MLKEVGAVWKRRGYGTNVGRGLKGGRLTHCAFADDITLVSRSWSSLKKMITAIKEALARRGLNLHPSKCKVQTNNTAWTQRGDIDIEEGFSVEILPYDEGLVVLGTLLHLTDPTGREIRNRVAAGWKSFWSMSRLLTNRKVSLTQRLKVFDGSVANSVLWCTESWTPREEELRLLETTRRAMLRRMAAVRRCIDETWLDWIQRATHTALAAAERAGVRCWKFTHFMRKWLWAGHVARRPSCSWLIKITEWRDSSWQRTVDGLAERPRRPSKRRWMRFEDRLRQYTDALGGETWMKKAQDREAWTEQAVFFATDSLADVLR